jgi:hypothetical protein
MYIGKKYQKLIMLLVAVSMISGILGACRKDGDGNEPKVSATSTASATVSASAQVSKTTSVSATSQKTITSETTKAAETSATAKNDAAAEITDAAENTPEEDMGIISVGDIELSDSKSSLIEYGVIPADANEEIIDLKGITITKAIWDESAKYLDNSTLFPDYTIMYRKIKGLEEKYNFKFEYVMVQGGINAYPQSIISQTMAGIKPADIIKSKSQWSFPGFVNQKIILPLNDYINFEAPIIKNSAMYSGTFWNNKNYGIYWSPRGGTINCLYNKDLLDREGQPDILELVENNQWTWEAFQNIAINCTRDINGDGITDQWGITNVGNWGFTEQMIYSNGGSAIIINDKGEAVVNLHDPKVMRSLQFASDLVFIHKVYKTDSKKTIYTNGSCAMSIATATNNTAILNQGVNSYVVPLPMGPDVSTYQNVNTYNADAISSLCENPEFVTRFWMEVNLLWDENLNRVPELEKLYSEIYPPDWDWSESNASRQIRTERESIIQRRLSAGFSPDYALCYPDVRTRMAALVATPLYQGQSVTTVIDSAKDELQAMLDQYN